MKASFLYKHFPKFKLFLSPPPHTHARTQTCLGLPSVAMQSDVMYIYIYIYMYTAILQAHHNVV